MANSWDIKNGDIIFNNGVQIVTGTEKIVQDLESMLLNDLGYNHFHPWMGSSLDSYIGSLPQSEYLYEIRQEVEKTLSTYYDMVLDDIHVRAEEQGSVERAIALADPSSIIVEAPKAEVWTEGYRVVVSVSFKTLYNQRDMFKIDLGNI